jgi:hypothetical protein
MVAHQFSHSMVAPFQTYSRQLQQQSNLCSSIVHLNDLMVMNFIKQRVYVGMNGEQTNSCVLRKLTMAR